jgi:tetratricopeptide (TPR) repeat protein
MPHLRDLVIRPAVCFVFCAVGFLWTMALPLPAQDVSHEMHEMVGWVPREILERPVAIRQGIGVIHEKVTTSSFQAQAFYDQGLTYLYSYVWIEAARSFQQALRLDPALAMGYVGLCDTYVGLKDVPAARAALDKAKALGTKVTDRERHRIEICDRRLEFVMDSQNPQRFFAYRTAIQAALADNPTDPWFWILRGFADEGIPFGRGQGGGVDSIAFYETALKFAPNNPVAHHYLAHSFENIGQVKEALEHSEVYARLAPSIPHAHHMHGHDLTWAGLTDQAILEFRKADELENAYYRSEHIPAEYDWHHAHNLTLLAMCYHAVGQVKTAEKLLHEVFGLPAYIDIADFNRSEWPQFLLNRGRAPEALEASQVLESSRWGLARFEGHVLAGRALLAEHRIEDAKAELSKAEQELGLRSSPGQDGVQPPAGSPWAPQMETLRAEILLHEKKWEEADVLMKRVEEELRAMPGVDSWSQALFQLESVARVAREAGDWNLAEFTARKMIDQDSEYAGGHFELALAAESQGNAETATAEFATAEKLWNEADRDLPELRVLHEKLSASR